MSLPHVVFGWRKKSFKATCTVSTHNGSGRIRKISSIEGLTENEQDRMAHILVSNLVALFPGLPHFLFFGCILLWIILKNNNNSKWRRPENKASNLVQVEQNFTDLFVSHWHHNHVCVWLLPNLVLWFSIFTSPLGFHGVWSEECTVPREHCLINRLGRSGQDLG